MADASSCLNGEVSHEQKMKPYSWSWGQLFANWCLDSVLWHKQCVPALFSTVSPLETHLPPFFLFVRELLQCYSRDANMCTCWCRSSITQVTVAECFGLGHPDLCSPLVELQEFGQAGGFSMQSHIPKIAFRSHSFLDPVEYILLKISIRIIKTSFRLRPGWQHNDEQVGRPTERPRPAGLIQPLRWSGFGDPGFDALAEGAFWMRVELPSSRRASSCPGSKHSILPKQL